MRLDDPYATWASRVTDQPKLAGSIVCLCGLVVSTFFYALLYKKDKGMLQMNFLMLSITALSTPVTSVKLIKSRAACTAPALMFCLSGGRQTTIS